MNDKPEINEDAEVIVGEFDNYKDWVMDPKGYFLIRVNKEEQVIELGFCKESNKLPKIDDKDETFLNNLLDSLDKKLF